MDKVKYNLLINHFKHDSSYIFPVKFLHGSDRSLNFYWLIEYPFLVYSISEHTLIQPYVSIITSALESQFLFEILNKLSLSSSHKLTIQIFLLKQHTTGT